METCSSESKTNNNAKIIIYPCRYGKQTQCLVHISCSYMIKVSSELHRDMKEYSKNGAGKTVYLKKKFRSHFILYTTKFYKLKVKILKIKA